MIQETCATSGNGPGFTRGFNNGGREHEQGRQVAERAGDHPLAVRCHRHSEFGVRGGLLGSNVCS